MTTRTSDVDVFLDEWTNAELNGDARALERLLVDDFTGVGPLGFTLSKEAWLARHAPGGLEYRAFDLNDVAVRRYGDTEVIVAEQQATGSYRGQEVPGDLRITLVVVGTSGGRRLAGAHMSFIAGTPGAPTLR